MPKIYLEIEINASSEREAEKIVFLALLEQAVNIISSSEVDEEEEVIEEEEEEE
jgi:hypothetical protein